MPRPTDLQIALAIVIIKRKPKDVFIKDYLRDLHAVLKRGPSSSHPLHIDQNAYWQCQLTVTRDLLSKEQELSFSLQQQVKTLQSQLNILQTKFSGGAAKSPTKRKPVEDGRTFPKRVRLDNDELSMVPVSFSIDFDVFDIDQPGRKALRNLLELHDMLRGQMYNVDPKRLAAHVTNTALAISDIIAGIHMRSSSNRPREISHDSHISTITAVSRAYSTLLHALTRLSSYRDSEQLTSNAIVHCARIIDSTFTTIEETATDEAKTLLTAELTVASPSKSRRVLEKGTQNTRANHALMTYLTNFVSATIDHLSTEIGCHGQLLEATLYFLLQRLGEMEHLFAFDRPQTGSVEEDLAIPLQTWHERRLDPTRLVERRAMRIETPYMIAILRKALKAVPKQFKETLAQGSRDVKFQLNPHALDRLQRTLVDCIFGPGDREARQLSKDVLTMPVLKGPVVTVAELAEEEQNNNVSAYQDVDVAEKWFESQLWSLMGWDILAKEENL